MNKLDESFYDRDTLDVSKDLLGKYLVSETSGKKLVGKIVETEAYKGPIDKAAHSYNGKVTDRNRVMFGPPGRAYIYIIYGMYICLNVVTEKESSPCAVLLRAVEPLEGLDIMALNRYGHNHSHLSKKAKIDIANGPGKLCIAMGITMKEYGEKLWDNRVYITEGEDSTKISIATSPRINISYAEEAALFPWRFYIEGNKYVSKARLL